MSTTYSYITICFGCAFLALFIYKVSATFLLLGKSPTPSDYAARAKSSFTANLLSAPKSTKINSPLFTVAFAFVKCLRDNRA